MFSIFKDKRTSKRYDVDNDLIESSQRNLSGNFTSIPNSGGLLAGDETQKEYKERMKEEKN